MSDYIDHGDAATSLDFRTKLQSFTVQAVCGRPYILTSKLIRWLQSPAYMYKAKPTITNCLLDEAYSRYESDPQVSREDLTDNENRCLLVFAILLELESGHLIHHFRRHWKFDNKLPFDLHALKSTFNTISAEDADSKAEAFYHAQWKYSVKGFAYGGASIFDKNAIIPIHRKELINNKGGTATLWMIEVLEEFVEERLKEAVKNSLYDLHDNLGPRYQFALKTFQEGNKSPYENEKSAFFTLRDHGGMISYLGEYEHQEPRQTYSTNLPRLTLPDKPEEMKTTYNILLEYGKYDLDELFDIKLPPVLPNEIESFWESLFEIAKAIDLIHNRRIDNDGMVKEYYGWHADIKPDNILIVAEDGPDGNEIEKYKLADPGFAKFVKKTGPSPIEVPLSGGTETYGAPERHPSRKDTLNAQTIDTWSLGCVFSITATWIVLGHQGIKQYERVREKETRRLIREAQGQLSSQAHPQSSTLKLTPGDYFHDGCEVLKVVTDWHVFLRNSLRKTDTITTLVLDLVDQNMLVGSSALRMGAKELCRKLEKVLLQSKMKDKMFCPEIVMNVLLEVNKEAQASTGGSVSSELTPDNVQTGNEIQDRKARKSKLRGVPLKKTTHRSSYRKSTLTGISKSSWPPSTKKPQAETALNSEATKFKEVLDNDGLVLKDIGGQQVESPTQLEEHPASPVKDFQGSPLQNPRLSLISPYRTLAGSLNFTGTKQKFKTTKSCNVFQARAEIEEREGNSKGLFRRKRKDTRDTLLARHYNNRDIVFLIDNAETMIDSWFEAKFLLETLLMKSAGLDEDGMDLQFTIGSIHVERKIRVSRFLKSMDDDAAKPKPGMRTDMRKSLNSILDNYHNRAAKCVAQNENPRQLTLIVLTDGIWSGMSNKEAIADLIENFTARVNKLIDRPIDRLVSIEFVQFGHDINATQRLRWLDDSLNPDIIDTEHCTGDVNKMLLGSFVEEYDEKEDYDIISTTQTPSIQQSSDENFESYSHQNLRTTPPFSMNGSPFELPERPPPEHNRPFSVASPTMSLHRGSIRRN